MPKPIPVIIQGAVEGPLDEAVLRQLIRYAAGLPGTVYGKQGKSQLLQRLRAYNQAARSSPWAILIDLDQDADCAPPFLSRHIPQPSAQMCCRVAVRSIEAWLLADREHLAKFLDVAFAKIPQNPEALANPKQTLVELARHSQSRDVREDLVPRPSSGRSVGSAYVSRLIEFIKADKNGWRPDVAAKHSDSLYRCLHCLRRLTGKLI